MSSSSLIPHPSSLVALTDLRFLPAHEGPREPCAACDQGIRHGHACAVAVLQIAGRRERWGHLVCSHCRALPQEKIVKAILDRSLRHAREQDADTPLVPLTEFQRALISALQ